MNLLNFTLESIIFFLPIFSNYLIYLFAFVVIIALVKLLRYLLYV